jgi:hypothetical protein
MSLGCWLMFKRVRSMLRQAICSQCDAAISLFASVEYIPQDGGALKEPLVGGPFGSQAARKSDGPKPPLTPAQKQHDQ